MKPLYYSTILTGVVMSLTFSGPGFAAPQGGNVAAGAAAIVQGVNRTDIHQHSNKAIIDWRSFDVDSNEAVQFHQPSSSSIALNRINDTKASQIDGSLTANGHIMLINPNGVVFGQGAQVDVGGLTATTADIDNDEFMAGRLNFNKAGVVDGAVVNHGSITVKQAGLVSFVAPQVENHGVITATLGTVQLAASDTFTLDLAGDGFLQVAVSDEDAKKLASNTGRITAEGGMIALTASHARNIVDSLVENTGIIEATSMTNQGGTIWLGGAHTKVSGTVKADGKTGGGEILIGGDYQGQGDMLAAEVTEIASDAFISANGQEYGDGGRVIVWANRATRFEGEIEATGGAVSGDGGFVEVSGKQYLEYDGDVDLSGGALGTLLIDPDDIDIVAGGTNPGEFTDDLVAFAENGTGITTIGSDTVSGRLSANANVILQANNTIDVNAAITSSGSGDLTLETGAGGAITVHQAIDVNTGDLTLKADEINILDHVATTGILTMEEVTASRTIGIGSGIGSLEITNAELALLSASSFIFGGSNGTDGTSGDVQINTPHDFGDSNVTFRSGEDIDLAGTLTKASGTGTANYVFEADGNIYNTDDGNEFNDNGPSITANSGAFNLTFHADKDNNDLGAINLIDSDITTGGGHVVMGGGLDPTIDYAVGSQDGIYDNGITLERGSIITSGGNLSLFGMGEANGTRNRGVFTSGQTLSTGTGSIVIDGVGAGDGNGENRGVALGGTISVTDGDIDIFGTAGFGAANNSGISAGGVIESTNDGNITLTSRSRGIGAFSLTLGSATMQGDIKLVADSYCCTPTSFQTNGAFLFENYTAGTTVGVGNGGGFLRFTDAYLANTSASSYIFGSSTSGDVDVDTTHDFGDADVTFISGEDIDLAGTLTKGTGTGTVNYIFEADGNITNSSGADIIITDNGAAGLNDDGMINVTFNSDKDEDSDGVIDFTNMSVISGGGNIILGGGANPLTGYAEASASAVGDGISLHNTDFDAGGGDISLRGQGSLNAGCFGNCYGMQMTGGSSFVTIGSGSITMDGIGGGDASTNNNSGIQLRAGEVLSTADGDINLIGDAVGTLSSNNSLSFRGSSITTTGNGNINLTAKNNGVDAFAISSTITSANDLTVTTDSISSGALVSYTAANTLTFEEYTDGTTIGIGTGAGDLSIDDTELALLSAGNIIFGGGTAGTSGEVTLDSAHNFGSDVTVRSGGDIAQAGDVNVGPNTLTLDAATAGNITHTGGTLTADRLNLDAAGTLAADVNVATALDIGSNSSDATLTGLFQGAASQAVANLITGGPGDNNAYTFEGFTIRQALSGAGTLPATVLQQIQLRTGALAESSSNIANTGENSSSDNTDTNTARRKMSPMEDLSAEPNASVRIIEANLMEVEQEVVDFYGLCAYNVRFCN